MTQREEHPEPAMVMIRKCLLNTKETRSVKRSNNATGLMFRKKVSLLSMFSFFSKKKLQHSTISMNEEDDLEFDDGVDLVDPLGEDDMEEIDPETATLDDMVDDILENVPQPNDFMEEEEQAQQGQKISNEEILKKIPMLEKMIEFLEPKYFIFLETTNDAFATIQGLAS